MQLPQVRDLFLRNPPAKKNSHGTGPLETSRLWMKRAVVPFLSAETCVRSQGRTVATVVFVSFKRIQRTVLEWPHGSEPQCDFKRIQSSYLRDHIAVRP